MYKIKVEHFEGPLDLLLQLIEDQKLEITKVALAEVTEQYIQVLNQSAKNKITAEILADFLVVASRLLFIKSKALLPFLEWDDDEDGEELTKQLKIYKEYLDASKVINKMILRKRFAFSRQKILFEREVKFSPPLKLNQIKLGQTFTEIIIAHVEYLTLVVT